MVCDLFVPCTHKKTFQTSWHRRGKGQTIVPIIRTLKCFSSCYLCIYHLGGGIIEIQENIFSLYKSTNVIFLYYSNKGINMASLQILHLLITPAHGMSRGYVFTLGVRVGV